jgi:hypothetical protein
MVVASNHNLKLMNCFYKVLQWLSFWLIDSTCWWNLFVVCQHFQHHNELLDCKKQATTHILALHKVTRFMILQNNYCFILQLYQKACCCNLTRLSQDNLSKFASAQHLHVNENCCDILGKNHHDDSWVHSQPKLTSFV